MPAILSALEMPFLGYRESIVCTSYLYLLACLAGEPAVVELAAIVQL
jgi:hypothetical protein